MRTIDLPEKIISKQSIVEAILLDAGFAANTTPRRVVNVIDDTTIFPAGHVIQTQTFNTPNPIVAPNTVTILDTAAYSLTNVKLGNKVLIFVSGGLVVTGTETKIDHTLGVSVNGVLYVGQTVLLAIQPVSFCLSVPTYQNGDFAVFRAIEETGWSIATSTTTWGQNKQIGGGVLSVAPMTITLMETQG